MGTARRGPGRIVVGVNRSAASRAAVLWAAQEAYLRHNVLLVTHLDLPSAYSPEPDDGTAACGRLLVQWASLASDEEPSIAVGTVLLKGGISDALIRLSRSADLLVVGLDQKVGGPGPDGLGSIEDRVLLEAHCPVVMARDRARSAATVAGHELRAAAARQRAAQPPPEAVPACGS